MPLSVAINNVVILLTDVINRLNLFIVMCCLCSQFLLMVDFLLMTLSLNNMLIPRYIVYSIFDILINRWLLLCHMNIYRWFHNNVWFGNCSNGICELIVSATLFVSAFDVSCRVETNRYGWVTVDWDDSADVMVKFSSDKQFRQIGRMSVRYLRRLLKGLP